MHVANAEIKQSGNCEPLVVHEPGAIVQPDVDVCVGDLTSIRSEAAVLRQLLEVVVREIDVGPDRGVRIMEFSIPDLVEPDDSQKLVCHTETRRHRRKGWK